MIAPTRTTRRPNPTPSVRPRAFTTIELLVAVGLLAITIVAVSEIFDISSEAANRTAAHADVMAASAAVQQRLTSLLSKMAPGLLIIESPPPTGPREDVHGGRAYFRMRHDRLVFIATGGPGEFQSFTDPRRGTPINPTLAPAQSDSALIYFGPGVPLENAGDPRQPRPFDDDRYALPGADWILAHRAILLLLDAPVPDVPGWAPLVNMNNFTAPGGMLNGGPLATDYLTGGMDVVTSDVNTRATPAAFTGFILDKPLASDLLTANPSIRALWEPNWCPTSVTLVDPLDRDYYSRSGFNFQPRLADFRIEWTDGRRIDPAGGDHRTRWFGLRPDPASVPDLNSPANINYLPVLRQQYTGDTLPAEDVAFGITGGANTVEWSVPAGGGSDPFAQYRATWRTDTWAHRPKALRFTYRIYDAGNRLKHTAEIDLDEDGDFDPDDPVGQPDLTRHSVTRYGQEFSIVVPIP